MVQLEPRRTFGVAMVLRWFGELDSISLLDASRKAFHRISVETCGHEVGVTDTGLEVGVTEGGMGCRVGGRLSYVYRKARLAVNSP